MPQTSADLQIAFDLQSDILKLAVADLSREPKPYEVPIPPSRVEDIPGFCRQLAILSVLFGYRSYGKILLEAYLWMAPVQRKLQRLGWLEGGVVVIDRGKQAIRLPQAEAPEETLRLPMIFPETKRESRMTLGEYESAWDALNAKATLFPDVDRRCGVQREPLLRELRELSYSDSCAAGPLTGSLVAALQKLSETFRGALFPDHGTLGPGDECLLAELCAHLGAMTETEHIRRLRIAGATSNPTFAEQTEFLRFFAGEMHKVSRYESDSRTLFVADGEVSLILLEYCYARAKEPRVAVRENLEQLGLAKPARARRFAEFVRDILDLPGAARHEALKPILDGDGWKWLLHVGWDPTHRAQITTAVAALLELPPEAAPADRLRAVMEIAAALGLKSPRKVAQIQRYSPISLAIHDHLRRGEDLDRALLAFPLTGFRLDGSEIFRNIVAYAVGTISQGPEAEDAGLLRQIEALRSLIATACWPTIIKQLEIEDRTVQLTASTFGHDLMNRLREMDYPSVLEALREALPEPAKSGPLGTRSVVLTRHLKMLHSLVELYRTFNRISSGILPWEWLDPRFAPWPPADLEPLLAATEAACLHVIKYVAGCYGGRLKDPILLLDGRGEAEPIDFRSLAGTHRVDPEIRLAPFQQTAGAMAVLAPLVELVRNAVKFLCDEGRLADLQDCFAVVALDYRIRRIVNDKDPGVEVELINPILTRSIESATILGLKRATRSFSAIQLELPSRFEDATGARFVKSFFRLFPGRLVFEKKAFKEMA